MDFDATDRYMSGWVISCVKGTVRFFVTDEGLPTDMLSRAAWYRWEADAREDATTTRNQWARSGERGFDWQPMRTAEALSLKG